MASDFQNWIEKKEHEIDNEPEQPIVGAGELLQYSPTNRVVSPQLARVCIAWNQAYAHLQARYPEDGDAWDWMLDIPDTLEQYYLTLHADWNARTAFERVAIAEEQERKKQRLQLM